MPRERRTPPRASPSNLGGWDSRAIFGVSDGLVTNISFLLGFAGANSSHNVVRLAGLATLVAGAFSMGTGEYLSMRAQKELFEYEIGVERQALADRPEAERLELRDLFVARRHRPGGSRTTSRWTSCAIRIWRYRRTRARELGVDPTATGKPIAAAFSFIRFLRRGSVHPAHSLAVVGEWKSDPLVGGLRGRGIDLGGWAIGNMTVAEWFVGRCANSSSP